MFGWHNIASTFTSFSAAYERVWRSMYVSLFAILNLQENNGTCRSSLVICSTGICLMITSFLSTSWVHKCTVLQGPAPSPPWPPPRRRRGPRPVADGSRRSSTRQPRWLCDDRITLLEENFKNSKNNFFDDHSVTTTRWLYDDLIMTTRLRRPSSYDDHPTEKKLKKIFFYFFLRRPSYDNF